MLFIMTTTTAHEFAAVSEAASTDYSRPALCLVQLRLERKDEEMTLRAIATESHYLANRSVTFTPGHYDAGSEDDAWVDEPNGILVDAKAWKKALKEAATGRFPSGRVLVDITPTLITILQDSPKATEVTLRPDTNYSYPKWRSLYSTGITEIEGLLPAFDPVRLADLAKMVSTKPADRDDYPMQLAVTKADNTNLGPWLFTVEHSGTQSSKLEVLLMPMRTADSNKVKAA